MSHPDLATDGKIVEVGKGTSSLLGSCLASSLFYLYLSKLLLFLFSSVCFFVGIDLLILKGQHWCVLSHFGHIQLCNPVDCSPLDSSVHGILQARILEWVAMPSPRGSSQSRHQTHGPCIAGRFFTAEPPG